MRGRERLKAKYFSILSFTGFNMILVSTLMLIPLLALFGWRSEWENSMGFFIPALSCAGMGMILWRVFESKERSTLSVAVGGIIVFLTWVLACVFFGFSFYINRGYDLYPGHFRIRERLDHYRTDNGHRRGNIQHGASLEEHHPTSRRRRFCYNDAGGNNWTCGGRFHPGGRQR